MALLNKRNELKKILILIPCICPALRQNHIVFETEDISKWKVSLCSTLTTILQKY